MPPFGILFESGNQENVRENELQKNLKPDFVRIKK